MIMRYLSLISCCHRKRAMPDLTVAADVHLADTILRLLPVPLAELCPYLPLLVRLHLGREATSRTLRCREATLIRIRCCRLDGLVPLLGCCSHQHHLVVPAINVSISEQSLPQGTQQYLSGRPLGRKRVWTERVGGVL